MSKRARPVIYRKGKAPTDAPGDLSDSDEDNVSQTRHTSATPASIEKSIAEISTVQPFIDPSSDRRLRRLQSSRNEKGEDLDVDSRRAARAQRARQARLEEVRESERDTGGRSVSVKMERDGGEDEQEREGDEEDEDAAAERRQRLRQKALERRRAEEEAALQQEAERVKEESEGTGEESDECTSEYTTDSEDETGPTRTLLKPVFIPKNHRETIFEKERMEREAEEAEQKRLKQAEERKQESHHMVEEELRKEAAAEEISALPTDVDDTDNIDEEAEFAAWKLRELLRIKRERAEKHAREQEKLDLERRRLMTDEEIARENQKLGKMTQKEKSQMRFMQKYYHKGAFYNDDGDVGKALQQRDFAAPTLEDKFDKSSLPAVMQVKNFGRAGQTKYTHLADQDTTSFEAGWAQKSEVNKRALNKLGGMKTGFDKPTKRRRMD
ncbi:Microfibrillar-associated protein 1 [Rhizophlyctis rosea]|uniref:Microfibrillar-associated protein 1 n=1 Tax=Rhizophlyctis rosea TaxID=64517 RepID=A0AAD5SIK4_9FUNG|nr:Microfibrillar-associated protein 1 [Rhizophlyctis rosea]